MPQIYSMARWGKPDFYGDKPTGDRQVRSIRHKKNKPIIKGCPGNNHNEHFYVSKQINYIRSNRTSVVYLVYCLLCDKRKTTRWGRVPKEEVIEIETVYGHPTW